MKNHKDNYYDGGDFSILIEQIEKDYTKENLNKYEKYGIGFIMDSLFIYDKIPFIQSVEDLYLSSKDGSPYSTTKITNEELDKIILLAKENEDIEETTYLNTIPGFVESIEQASKEDKSKSSVYNKNEKW